MNKENMKKYKFVIIFASVFFILAVIFTALFIFVSNHRNEELEIVTNEQEDISRDTDEDEEYQDDEISDIALFTTGLEESITWDKDKFNESSEISITIKLKDTIQTTGQSFDPLLFARLENTGEVTWDVHPMYPSGKYLLTISGSLDNAIIEKSIEIKNEVFDWEYFNIENTNVSFRIPRGWEIDENSDDIPGCGPEYTLSISSNDTIFKYRQPCAHSPSIEQCSGRIVEAYKSYNVLGLSIIKVDNGLDDSSDRIFYHVCSKRDSEENYDPFGNFGGYITIEKQNGDLSEEDFWTTKMILRTMSF